MTNGTYIDMQNGNMVYTLPGETLIETKILKLALRINQILRERGVGTYDFAIRKDDDGVVYLIPPPPPMKEERIG